MQAPGALGNTVFAPDARAPIFSYKGDKGTCRCKFSASQNAVTTMGGSGSAASKKRVAADTPSRYAPRWLRSRTEYPIFRRRSDPLRSRMHVADRPSQCLRISDWRTEPKRSIAVSSERLSKTSERVQAGRLLSGTRGPRERLPNSERHRARSAAVLKSLLLWFPLSRAARPQERTLAGRFWGRLQQRNAAEDATARNEMSRRVAKLSIRRGVAVNRLRAPKVPPKRVTHAGALDRYGRARAGRSC